jgi:Fur family zinc uptake transcriptional regulator
MAKPRFPAPDHDHQACLSASLERAENAYVEAGGRLTELRASVLRELAASHQALGAYDVIERMSAAGRRVAPISVYRALDSLLEVGLVHRIESRNAFIACHAAHDESRPILFLVCDSCGTVAESGEEGLNEALGNAAKNAKFTLDDTVLEMTGLCEHCAGGERARGH